MLPKVKFTFRLDKSIAWHVNSVDKAAQKRTGCTIGNVWTAQPFEGMLLLIFVEV